MNTMIEVPDLSLELIMTEIDERGWAVIGMYHDIKIWIEETAEHIWSMKGHVMTKDGKSHVTIKCNPFDKDGILTSLVQEVRYKHFHNLVKLDDLNYELETAFLTNEEEKITQWIKIKFVIGEV